MGSDAKGCRVHGMDGLTVLMDGVHGGTMGDVEVCWAWMTEGGGCEVVGTCGVGDGNG